MQSPCWLLPDSAGLQLDRETTPSGRRCRAGHGSPIRPGLGTDGLRPWLWLTKRSSTLISLRHSQCRKSSLLNLRASGFGTLDRAALVGGSRPFSVLRPTNPMSVTPGRAAAQSGPSYWRYRPAPAIHASKHSRRERPESRWSSHNSRSHAQRAISKAARQGSATPASMKSCSNGRGLANRIDAIDPKQPKACLRSSHSARRSKPAQLIAV